MKRRFFAILLVLMLSFAFVGIVNAEETPIDPPTTENTTPETNAPTGENNAPVVAPDDLPDGAPDEEQKDEPDTDAPLWGNTVTTTEFFDTVVMPALISVGTLILSFPVVGVPFLKAFGKVKSLGAALKMKTDENANLKNLLETTDVATFKSELEKILTADLKTAIQNVKIDEAAIAEMNAQIAWINARLENFMKAAENAWSASPAAVSLLTSADSTAIKAMSAKLAAYENYIRTEKGEEAEDIIHTIEEV